MKTRSEIVMTNKNKTKKSREPFGGIHRVKLRSGLKETKIGTKTSNKQEFSSSAKTSNRQVKYDMI
jgi:hypothetical protein